MILFRRLMQVFGKSPYIQGYMTNYDGSYRREARLNLLNGDVEFVLWEAGQHGHKVDYWHRFGDGWEDNFIKDWDMNNYYYDNFSDKALSVGMVLGLTIAIGVFAWFYISVVPY